MATSTSDEAAAPDVGWADESTALEWASGDRLPTAKQHADALTAAGLTDLDMPWRAFFSVLILARKPSQDRATGAGDPVQLDRPSEEGQTR